MESIILSSVAFLALCGAAAWLRLNQDKYNTPEELAEAEAREAQRSKLTCM